MSKNSKELIFAICCLVIPWWFDPDWVAAVLLIAFIGVQMFWKEGVQAIVRAVKEEASKLP